MRVLMLIRLRERCLEGFRLDGVVAVMTIRHMCCKGPTMCSAVCSCAL